ncbi:MAG: tripartite tricarboxylate transporter TctB family protein [Acidobacteria bacterium]|nr:tripartite tricarboxylate transporter TctB family protein [Acidobacteriota bacterium]
MSDGRRRSISLVEAGLLAVVGAGVLLDARGYPAPLIEGVPGPAFFPGLVAALLIACAGVLALRGTRAPQGAPESVRGVLRLLGATLWIAGFLLVLPLIGHLAALPPLVLGLMWLSGERSQWILMAVSLAFGGFVHLLFVVALGVPLP